jgi:hypothetical protein
MTRWLLAAIIGSMIAALHYGPKFRRVDAGGSFAVPALLRAVAATLLAALLLQAPFRGGSLLKPLVAIDVSASWMRGGTSDARWTEALDHASRAAAGDSVLLVGDSLRLSLRVPSPPVDVTSRPAAAADRARREGRPLVLITDGEGGDLAAASLTPGSRIDVLRRTPLADLAIVDLEMPARAAPGDTIDARLTIRSGEAGSAGGTVAVGFDGARAVEQAVAAGEAFAERNISARLVVPGASGPRLVTAVVRMPNDAEPRNDTVSTVVEVSRTPVAVLVSTAPDPDARDALEALRGALAAPPIGYYRVAPGQWRTGNALTALSEAEVRRALGGAPMAVIHGDTSLFGPPSAATRGSLILMVPGAPDTRTEWRASSEPSSPLSAALSGIAWDSVPPIEPAVSPARGDWTALSAVSGGERRAVVAGSDQLGRRRVVVAVGGTWRWRSRGGVAGDAYGALWGSIIDWVGRSRPDARAALPEAMAVREGDRIAWRRGGPDTSVTVVLSRNEATTIRDTVRLIFSGGAMTTDSPPLRAGRYAVSVPGGSAILAVNRTRELLPTRQTITSTVAPGRAPRAPGTPLRDMWLPFAAALAALCSEWILRRRIGLR